MGVEIISNGSGSHHQLRKLDQRLDLIRGATAKVGQAHPNPCRVTVQSRSAMQEDRTP